MNDNERLHALHKKKKRAEDVVVVVVVERKEPLQMTQMKCALIWIALGKKR